MTWALLVSVLAGAVAFVWQRLLWVEAVNALALEKRDANDTESQLKWAVDRAARLELVIASDKLELLELEEDLHACDVPGAVLERLRRISMSPGTAAKRNPAAVPNGASPG